MSTILHKAITQSITGVACITGLSVRNVIGILSKQYSFSCCCKASIWQYIGAFWRKTSWASTWGGQESNCRQNVHEHYLIELNVILQILLDLYAKTYFEQFFKLFLQSKKMNSVLKTKPFVLMLWNVINC